MDVTEGQIVQARILGWDSEGDSEWGLTRADLPTFTTVTGPLVVNPVPALGYTQYVVDGRNVDPDTITPVLVASGAMAALAAAVEEVFANPWHGPDGRFTGPGMGTKVPTRGYVDKDPAPQPKPAPTPKAAPQPAAAATPPAPVTTPPAPVAPVADTGPQIEKVDKATFNAVMQRELGYSDADYEARDTRQVSTVRAQQKGGGSFTPAVQKAHREYIGEGYTDINGVLRGTPPAGMSKAEERRHLKTAETLKRGFKPPPATPLTEDFVYRGVANDGIGPNLQPGMRFKDRGFVSTSHDPEATKVFAGRIGGPGGGDRTVYKIKPTNRMRHRPVLAGEPSEGEWILPAGSTFTVGKITEWEHKGGKDRIIELEWDGVVMFKDGKWQVDPTPFPSER